MKIVLFNGPTGSGKDTAAEYLKSIAPRDVYDYVGLLTIAKPIKSTVDNFLRSNGVTINTAKKNKPIPALGGQTLRSGYVAFGDSIRKAFGQSFFIDLIKEEIVQLCMHYDNPLLIVTDLGMQLEHDVLSSIALPVDWTIIQLHRPSANFKDDCREYVKVNTNCFAIASITNDGTKKGFLNKIENAAFFAGVLKYE